MAYKSVYGISWETEFSCDVCGENTKWKGHQISMATCRSIARSRGWSVDNKGWRCPACRRKRKAATAQ